jgi:membrane protease subunit (stomatin/prohibitin family)
MLKGQAIPVYAALFLKSAPIVKDFEGVGFTFEDTSLPDVKYAVQDENKGIKFVTQAFVELVAKYDLKIECKQQTHDKV